MAKTSRATPRTLTVRTPGDLVALAPLVLGFVPHDSLVMLTLEGERRFHARIDLPEADAPEAELKRWLGRLLGPVARHRVTEVALVFFSADAAEVRRLAALAAHLFRHAGAEVVESLRADGESWYPAVPPTGTVAVGTPYDLASHPFRADGVYHGEVTHASRAALAATVSTDAGAVARTTELLGRLMPVGEEVIGPHVERLPRADVAALGALCAWIGGNGVLAWCLVSRCLAEAPEHGLGRVVETALIEAVPPDV